MSIGPYAQPRQRAENPADQSRTEDVTIVQLGGARGAGLEHSVPDGQSRAVRMVAIPGADDDELGVLATDCGGSPL